ncbi:hypothetical protein I4U23_016166 [Adineta vaga]|nr:hypothetical protein I4U23_016166 [Adineta vaga]
MSLFKIALLDEISRLSSISRTITVIVGLPMFICGIVGNLINLLGFTFLPQFNKLSSSIFLLVSFLASEISLLVVLLPQLVFRLSGNDPLANNVILCKLRWFAGPLSATVALHCICLASINQYLLTSRNIERHRWITRRRAVLISCFVFIFWIGPLSPSELCDWCECGFDDCDEPIITCSTTATTNAVEKEKISTTIFETASTSVSYSTKIMETTTCDSRIPNVTTILYDFDQQVYDVYSNYAGKYNGVLKNSPSYVSPGITGYGHAIQFNSSSAQFVTISNWINLNNMSFTIEFWIKLSSINGNRGIFGQCQIQSADYCLHITVRSQKILFSFFSDNVTGSTSLSVGIWYHIACVYDVNSQEQLVYVNGILDGSHKNSTAFLAYNATSTIGTTYNNGFNTPCYFDGMIDQLSITQNYAKNASTVLDDATLTAYFSFDSPSDFSCDNGPNFLNGTYNNVSSVTGRLGNAIAFSATNDSNFTIDSKFVLLAIQNQAHSYALWINPVANSGTILQENSGGSSAWSMLPFGYMWNGTIVAHVWNGSIQSAVGNVPILNCWTHIAMTYNLTSGLSFYMNGSLFSTSPVSPLRYRAPGTPTATLTLGYTSQVNEAGNAGVGVGVGVGKVNPRPRTSLRCLCEMRDNIDKLPIGKDNPIMHTDYKKKELKSNVYGCVWFWSGYDEFNTHTHTLKMQVKFVYKLIPVSRNKSVALVFNYTLILI